MLISHRKKFIFLKTPKTAGTSLELVLQQFCLPDGMSLPHGTDGHEGPDGIVGRRRPPSAELIRYTNHMSAAEVREAVGETTWRDYLKITSVRNPFDRMVSYFWMAASAAAAAASSLSERTAALRRFVETQTALKPQAAHYQVDGAFAMDRLIMFETVQADTDLLMRCFGAEPTVLPRVKSDLRTSKLPFQAYYDEETARLVAEEFATDFSTLGYDLESWRVAPA